MIHAIHDGSVRGAAGSPFVIYGFGGSVNNFTDVVYPGQLNRCDACHVGTSYYPVDDTAVQATTFLTGLSKESPNPTTVGNPIATSANMSVCSACHVDALTATHMQQNGGSTTVTKDAEGRTIPEHQSGERGDLRRLSRCRWGCGRQGRAQHPRHGELSAAVLACLRSRWHSLCCSVRVCMRSRPMLRRPLKVHRTPILPTVRRAPTPASAATTMARSRAFSAPSMRVPTIRVVPSGTADCNARPVTDPGARMWRRAAVRSPAWSTSAQKRSRRQ